MAISDCKWIDLPVKESASGELVFIEGNRHIPFEIKRIYYIFGVPSTGDRGGHAHRNLQQVFVALNGSFSLHLDDGREAKTFRMDNPRRGLLVQNLVWRTLDHFADGSVCLVLASDIYKESDYCRTREQFAQALGESTCV